MEMSPTSKNALKIGAGLIVIALLLVCGPLMDRFGGSGVAPPIAAPMVTAPPVVEPDVLEAVVAGALVGNSAEELDPQLLAGVTGEQGAEKLPPVVPAVVPAVVPIESKGADVSKSPPSVSAAGPPVVLAATEPLGTPDTNAAPDAFDTLLANNAGLDSRAEDRFPIPVASGGPQSNPFGQLDPGLPRPCDAQGTGCRDLHISGSGFIGAVVRPGIAGDPRGGTP
jgi:hypothetical protein